MNPFLVLEPFKLSNFCFVWQTAPHPNDFLQETEPPGSSMRPCHICDETSLLLQLTTGGFSPSLSLVMNFPARSNRKGGEMMELVRKGERGRDGAGMRRERKRWGKEGERERGRCYIYGPVPNYNSRHPQFNKNNSSRMQP